MTVLLINAHPEPRNEHAYAVQMANHFARFVPAEQLEILNLYEADIPAINAQMLELFRKQAAQAELSPTEQALADRMEVVLRQFKSAKRIVIAMPLHNFNIPSRLKDYLDNVMIARETFKYVPGGSVGLMNDGRKVLMMQSSGSIYTNNDRYTPLDISYQYLKGVFGEIMGFNEFDIIRLQGTAVSAVNNEEALANALAEIEAKVPDFLAE